MALISFLSVQTALLGVIKISWKFGKKNDQNPPVGYFKAALGDLWLEKLLDTAGFTVVWRPQWLHDGFFFLLSVQGHCYWYYYDIPKVSYKITDQHSLVVSLLFAFNVRTR